VREEEDVDDCACINFILEWNERASHRSGYGRTRVIVSQTDVLRSDETYKSPLP